MGKFSFFKKLSYYRHLLYLGISERPVGRSEIPIYVNIILKKWD